MGAPLVLPSTVQRALVGAALGIGVSQDIPAADLVVQGVGLPLLIQSAKRGMHKGRGKGRRADFYFIKRLKESISDWAKHRQRELHAQGIRNSEAKERAAEEARVLAHERYGLNLATNTIMAAMEKIPIISRDLLPKTL